jgi:hypothetical protein
MSSRNVRLTAEWPLKGPGPLCRDHPRRPMTSAPGHADRMAIREAAEAMRAAGFDRVEYIELRDAETLMPSDDVTRPRRMLAACLAGRRAPDRQYPRFECSRVRIAALAQAPAYLGKVKEDRRFRELSGGDVIKRYIHGYVNKVFEPQGGRDGRFRNPDQGKPGAGCGGAGEDFSTITDTIEKARLKLDEGVSIDVENATLEDVHKHTDVMNGNIAELIMGLDDVTAAFLVRV